MNKRYNIEQYNWAYELLEDGTVISYRHYWKIVSKGKKLKPLGNKYLHVILWDDDRNPSTCRIHKLVAYKFLPNPNNYPVVRHLDNNKHNNHVSNLEWCTYSTNNQQAFDDWIKKPSEKQREVARNNWKKVMQLTKEGILCRIYRSATEASSIIWICRTAICTCARGDTKTCWGYYWKYV